MAEDLGERTEEATPKRREDARKEGNVARSQDFAGALLLAAVTFVLIMTGLGMLDQAHDFLAASLDGDAIADPIRADSVPQMMNVLGWGSVRLAAPVLLAGWIAGVIVHLIQVGWMFSPAAIQPQLSKLNPLKGFKRIFGLSGLVKAMLDSLKVLVVVTVAAVTVIQYRDQVLTLSYRSITEALAEGAWMVLILALRVLAVLIVLGVLDLMYQRWKHKQDLKMTKQQVKDELKQTEGDPEVKRRRFRMQQQIAMQRVGAAVPKADVIVTNPEHVSVAIKYEEAEMHAPKVIAKGADHLALRIRHIAARHEIPIVQRPPLARALYKQVEVGREIPQEFYKAVAEVLAYVYQLAG